jgi:predicted phosphodiesterase
MKIAVCSDLHLEFGSLVIKNTENADVLILGGDILVAKDLTDLNNEFSVRQKVAKEYYEFIANCCKEFKMVLFVAGNHEHYHGDFSETFDILHKHLKFDNLLILDKQSVRVNDVIFFGGTLWTDMNKSSPISINKIQNYMNDFRVITNKKVGEGCRFLPMDAVEDHNAFLNKLKTCLVLNPDTKFVVVGHHAPCKESTHPKYKNQTHMNGAYSSDLSELMLDNSNIKLWTHGHTHDEFDYMIGECRVVCNPRGYSGYEGQADSFKLKYLEI